MTDQDEIADYERRGVWARIGICLLNFLTPGLGLLRVGCTKAALIFMLMQLLGGGLIGLRYAYGPAFTFASWILFVAIAVVAFLLLYCGSIVMTWRASRYVEPRLGHLWRWYGLIAAWLVMAVLSKPLQSIHEYFHNYYIPAKSMLPLLQVNDRIIAQRVGAEVLHRGDVVIVRSGKVDYVKRIAGLPGDQISLKNGLVFINGQEVKQHKVSEIKLDMDGTSQNASVLEEQLPGEAQPHQVLDIYETPQDNWPGLSLGQDEYVVLGDNRDNSMDSRFPLSEEGFGAVKRSQITGKVLFRYWRSGVGLANGTIK